VFFARLPANTLIDTIWIERMGRLPKAWNRANARIEGLGLEKP